MPDAEVWPSLIPQPIPSSPTRTQPPTATVADRRRGFGIQASRARCLLSVHRLHMAQSFPDDIEVCTATLVRIAPGSSRVDCQELRRLYLICRFPPGQPSRAEPSRAEPPPPPRRWTFLCIRSATFRLSALKNTPELTTLPSPMATRWSSCSSVSRAGRRQSCIDTSAATATALRRS